MCFVLPFRRARRPASWPLEEWRCHLELSVAKRSVGTLFHNLHAFAREHRDPWAVRRADIESYLVRLGGRNGRAELAYQRSVLTAIKAFYRWAVVDRGYIDIDPAAAIKLRGGKTEPGKTCDEVTYARALKTAKDDPEVRLMLLLMGEAALRCAEVATCKGSAIDESGRWLTVLGKGDKTRSVPIKPHLRDAIAERGPGYTFPGGRGREVKPGHITPGNVGVRVSRLVRPYSAHGLRHMAAWNVYRNTRDLEAVRQVLGHNSLTTTQIYLGCTGDEVWTSWTRGIEQAGEQSGLAVLGVL